ncbi:hypothetical protein [Nocardia noduli]|uniref:hypothetical protein n=1 Tax=Nocardia noduli TaxID=2815722 RepID=UPI001C21D147|nr:hypothetical protein [Nocardia noduli]
MNTKITVHQTNPADAITDAVLGIVWVLVKAAAVLVWWVLLFPMVSAPIALVVVAGLLVSPVAAAVLGGVFAVGMVLWRLGSPQTFERWITSRARSRFLAWFRYRRRWTRMLSACGLQVVFGEQVATPRLAGVRVGAFTDRVTVRMLPGQCPDDYTGRTAHLAHAFGVLECRAVIVGPSTVELAFRHRDSLAEPVTLPPRTSVEWLWDEKEAA